MRVMQSSLVRIGMVLTAALTLAGCPKKPEIQPETNTPTAATNSNAETSGANENQSGATSNLEADRAAMQELQKLGMVIYFDYDKAEIKPEYVPVLAAHARYLNGNPNRKVRLEGNTDERGSREYNIGLGERRAQAVRRALMLQGVNDSQITTISYGEERPVAMGSDEEAYKKNRRVDIVYGQ